MRKRWTKEEDRIIKENLNKMGNKELAKKLEGRTEASMKSRMRRLGLRRDPEFRKHLRTCNRTDYKHWTDQEDQFIKENINKLSNREMSNKMEGRTLSAVTNRVTVLGLNRDHEFRKEIRKRTQFEKGHEPWNKDLKGIHVSPETEFKPGHKPANTKPVGTIVTRERQDPDRDEKYKFIKISDGNWELLHRFVWQKHNGKLPESHIVGFKNGDTLDCRIDNLYCMSRAEQVRENYNPEKASIAMKRRWENGEINLLASKKYLAFCLFPRNKEARKLALQNEELLELKREQIKLRRAINESKQQD